MTFLARIMSAIYLGLTCLPVLMGGQYPHDAHPRTAPVLPMSSPFTLTDAVKLPEWIQIRRLTERIQTDTGSLELLHELPEIEAKYGNESYFLDLVRKWRNRIPILPEKPAMEDEGDSSWIVLQNGGARTISITFYDEAPGNSITILAITWAGRQVTNLSFTAGYDNVLRKSPRLRHRLDRPESFPTVSYSIAP